MAEKSLSKQTDKYERTNPAMIVPVILSGGSGSRLWPLSRQLYPKQLLALTGESTLIQQTANRLRGMDDAAPPIVICNEEHRFLVAEQMQETGIKPGAIILEPMGRNTAPAVAVAAFHAMEKGEDPLLLVLPADHIIKRLDVFQDAVQAGADHAVKGGLVTFGIVPEGPETGYGYIKKGAIVEEFTDRMVKAIYLVDRFVEKPDRPTAEKYVESGEYFWNSGMFLFRASTYLEELKKFEPDMYKYSKEACSRALKDLDFTRLDKEAFEKCPSDSIDYAVMERTEKALVVPVDAGWSDIGSWSALWETGLKDSDGNVLHGDVITHDTKGSYLYSDGRLIAAVGLRDHIVIETADAVLVAPKNRVQEIKTIVNYLKGRNRQEAYLHRRVYRPWGSYETIATGDRFQVKLITVNPGATLSLQMHHHRAEHWIVVKGTALVTRGEEELMLSENQSTFIPLGTKHRLENPGVIPLELIEVQSGSYLGEDDIVRFDDIYGRTGETPRA